MISYFWLLASNLILISLPRLVNSVLVDASTGFGGDGGDGGGRKGGGAGGPGIGATATPAVLPPQAASIRYPSATSAVSVYRIIIEPLLFDTAAMLQREQAK
jgi:hypothetical protein